MLATVAEEARIAPDRLRPDATLAELGIASIDTVSILFAIEDRFGVAIDPEALGDVSTLGGFVERVVAAAPSQ